MRMQKTIILAFVLIPAIAAATVEYDRRDALQTSQAAIGSVVGDYTLRDVAGQANTFQPFPMLSVPPRSMKPCKM